MTPVSATMPVESAPRRLWRGLFGRDRAHAAATSPFAPADERYDAQAELAKAHLPDPRFVEMIRAVVAQNETDMLLKAQPRGMVLDANGSGRAPRGPGGQSVFLDDFQLVAQGDYWDRPGVLSFGGMRDMVAQTPVLNAIILTRIRQVLRFCRPQSGPADAGFAIKHVDRNVELDDAQQASVKHLTRFMLNGGWETDPRQRKRLKRDPLFAFMAKSVRDTLTMDSAPIETEFKRDRRLGLDGFYAVDGETIRLCTEQGYQGRDEVFAVQVIQGVPRTAYTYDQLIYEPRNPRTDVTLTGYGYSETEMLIRTVTYLLNTMTYNGSFFDKNAIPRGLLNLAGDYSPDDLESFKRHWNAMVRGINNAHAMPVMVSKDGQSKAEFVEFGGQLSEMAFGKWLSFLTSVACAIFGIAPEEISMESYAASRSPLSGSDTEEKLVSSSDKGLLPLLAYYENLFSEYLIQPFSPDYCFRFEGVNADDAQKRFELRKLASTMNEARAGLGLDPLDGPLGDAPLNPSLVGVWQQLEQAKGEDFGDPDAGGPDAGGEGDAGQDDAQGDDDRDFGADPDAADGGSEGAPAGQADAPGGPGGAGASADPRGREGFAKALREAEALGLPVFRLGDEGAWR